MTTDGNEIIPNTPSNPVAPVPNMGLPFDQNTFGGDLKSLNIDFG